MHVAGAFPVGLITCADVAAVPGGDTAFVVILLAYAVDPLDPMARQVIDRETATRSVMGGSAELSECE